MMALYGRKYDIFISYRRPTGARDARMMQLALANRGYSAFFDYTSLKDGKFNEAIYSAIDSCEVFILMMTEGVLDRCVDKDDFVRLEILRALEKKKHIVPVAPSDQKWSFPTDLPEELSDIRLEQVSKLDMENLFESSLDEIEKFRFSQELKARRRLPGVAPSTDYYLSSVTHASEVFVGRAREYNVLAKMLSDNKVPVITGAGGTGKSELVRQYAVRCREAYPGGRFQVDMETARTWDDVFAKLMDGRLGTGQMVRDLLDDRNEDEKELPIDVSQALLRRARKMGPVLIFLDNVESVQAFVNKDGRLPVFPVDLAEGMRIDIVMTTRVCDANLRPTGCVASLALGDLSPDVAQDLLLKERPTADEAERTAAGRVAALLGYRALYLRRVPALIDDINADVFCDSFAELEKELRANPLDVVAAETEDTHWPETLWKMTCDRLAKKPLGPECIKLAQVASFFSPDGVTLHILRHLWKTLVAPSCESKFDRVLEILRRYNILQSTDPVCLHRLDREAILKAAKVERDLEESIGTSLKSCELLCQEDFVEALAIYRHLAASNPEKYEGDVATTLDNLANLHTDHNLLDAAEEEYGEALAIRRRLAASNPEKCEGDVATTLNNLAKLHAGMYRLEAAEEAYVEALAIRRRLADVNPLKYEGDVASTLNNLAYLHAGTDHLGAAEGEYDEAYAIFRRLAKASPLKYRSGVATTLNNLAILHADTNRYEMAEGEYEKALAGYRRLAEENPSKYQSYVALALNNLANLHTDMNRLEASEGELNEARTIIQAQAEDNPSKYESLVATLQNNLAFLHENMNRHEAAEGEYGEALTIRRRLAEAHPSKYEGDVATTLNNIAILHMHTNRLEAAEEEHTDALAIRRRQAEKRRSKYDGRLAGSLHNLAILHAAMAQFETAEGEYVEALAIFRRLAGDAPSKYECDVASTLNDLALLHVDMNRLEEAVEECAEALSFYENLAAEHPEKFREKLAKALSVQAKLYIKMGDRGRAKSILERTMAIRRELVSVCAEKFTPNLNETIALLESLQKSGGVNL